MDSFDRVEDLARTMCEAAGGGWDAKGTKRNYWRAKAGDALAQADRPGLGDAPDWVLGFAALGWLVAGGALLALGLT